MKTNKEIRFLLSLADRASDECQAAYGRGDIVEGQRLEILANEAAQLYQASCDESPENAPMTMDA